jgi:hypothetical protein
MYKKEEMDQRLHTIVAIAEKELTVLLNSDLITIRDYLKDKKLYQDHTVECYALDV